FSPSRRPGHHRTAGATRVRCRIAPTVPGLSLLVVYGPCVHLEQDGFPPERIIQHRAPADHLALERQPAGRPEGQGELPEEMVTRNLDGLGGRIDLVVRELALPVVSPAPRRAVGGQAAVVVAARMDGA